MTLEPVPDDLARETLAYRRALGAFATGVCVVTARTSEGALGITINSFTSVSLEPRLILWCLHEQSERWAVFAAADHFAVHVLPARARDLAARFARGVCDLSPEEIGGKNDEAPRLKEAVARFDCRTHERIQMGDHLVIVGEVTGFEATDGDSLLFHRGRYGSSEGLI